MKDKHDTYFLIGIGLALFLYLRPRSETPGQPGFVGPVQTPYIPTVSVIGGVPMQLPATINWRDYCFDFVGNPYLNPNPGTPCPTA